jgi:thymidylate synthase
MIFVANSSVEAWIAVTRYLINSTGHEAFNVLVQITDASATDEASMLAYDPRSLGSNYDSIRDVANTIFPLKTLKNSTGRQSFYQRYLRAHSKSRHKRWGTYFQRFISFGSKKENQLENIIHALSTWPYSYKAAFSMHTSSAETDSLKPLGNPCLQYVQFNCPNKDQLDLVAVYRNHDYCNKALGNFIGLTRLLNFVSNESNRIPGTITCLSVHAYFDTSIKSQQKLAKL